MGKALTLVLALVMILGLCGCAASAEETKTAETQEPADGGSAREDSPAWVGELEAARDAEQLFIVAGVGQTTATVSMHEKDENGVWKQIIMTPGFIGRNGLGKEREGDGKTPVGTFGFNCAFGIGEDPGCALEYHQVTEDDYWSGDQREGYHYNELVSIRDLSDLNTADSEHIVDYQGCYEFCLNVSYNEEAVPGLGSGIFLHCFRVDRPFTGGCISIPREKMITVMQNVRPDCVVLIDSLENISPETWEDWGLGD